MRRIRRVYSVAKVSTSVIAGLLKEGWQNTTCLGRSGKTVWSKCYRRIWSAQSFRVSTCARSNQTDDSSKKKQHTLARKFDVVHKNTTAKSRQMPRVRLAAPPKRCPLLALRALMGWSRNWSICDLGCINGACSDGETGDSAMLRNSRFASWDPPVFSVSPNNVDRTPSGTK